MRLRIIGFFVIGFIGLGVLSSDTHGAARAGTRTGVRAYHALNGANVHVLCAARQQRATLSTSAVDLDPRLRKKAAKLLIEKAEARTDRVLSLWGGRPRVRSAKGHLRLNHVGPRDGEQGKADVFGDIPTGMGGDRVLRALAMARTQRCLALAQTGFLSVEAGTYGKTNLPSMKPSKDVFNLLRGQGHDLQRFPFLALTPTALKDFFKDGGRVARIVIGATDEFNEGNLGRCTRDVITRMQRAILESGRSRDGEGKSRVELYISDAFYAPGASRYEQYKRIDGVARVAEGFVGLMDFVTLSDTRAIATPKSTSQLLRILKRRGLIYTDKTGLHFHRRSDGYEHMNVLAGFSSGINCFDVGYDLEATGGCPVVTQKGSSKPNLSDLDTVMLFEKMGIPTGIDVKALAEFNTRLSLMWYAKQRREALKRLVI